ncbi:unnamed protein product [Adineta ricciae]|uniref:Uncharacterized protein n=1 Tax=Adineta ricciae TaxID=249248 RepID=A0A815LZF4_ADIRI|nr:unnamed protein product [Adineta ricciae]CAF1677639.1 unnamed protein product [Adineta ricciae]
MGEYLTEEQQQTLWRTEFIALAGDEHGFICGDQMVRISKKVGLFSSTAQVIMARSVPTGSSHFPAVSCKLRSGNGQELIGYFLCNSGRNPAARNLPELAVIGENCVGIEKSCTGTDSDFNGSSRRNDRPGGVYEIFDGSMCLGLEYFCSYLTTLREEKRDEKRYGQLAQH